MRTGRAVGFVAAVVAVIMSVLSVGAARASGSSSVSIHTSGVLRSDEGSYFYGQFPTVDQGLLTFTASLSPDSFTDCTFHNGQVYWQVSKLLGHAVVAGTGTFSFQPAPACSADARTSAR